MDAGERILNKPVLVLNRGYQAYAVFTVRDAIMAVAAGRAEAVDHADPYSYQSYTWADWTRMRPAAGDEVVRHPSGEMVAPQVIRMTEYATIPRRGVTCSRINILKRDRYACQYCGRKVTGESVTFDHVVPRGQGGTFSWTNIVCACYPCNQKKACRTPKQAGMKLKTVPVKPDWEPDFGRHAVEITSWQKFLDSSYWLVNMQE